MMGGLLHNLPARAFLKFLLLLLLLLNVRLLLAGGQSGYTSVLQARDYLAQGVIHYKNKKQNLALESLNMALKLDPGFAEAYYYRGLAHDMGFGWSFYDTAYYDKSISDFSRAIELNPEYEEAYFQRGKAYTGKREYIKAIADFTYAIRLNDRVSEYYSYRAFAHKQAGTITRALQDYKVAILVSPDDFTYYRELGFTQLWHKVEIDQGCENLQKACVKVKCSPTHEYLLLQHCR